MKTFGTCSGCSGEHHWREIDFDNTLYVDRKNAICLTLCPVCREVFLKTKQTDDTVQMYKQRINHVLKGKSKPVLDFNLGQQSNAALSWGLHFF
jgi:heterodisulfide reductase subunit B